MNNLLFLTLINLICFSTSDEEDKLIFLYTHFRHGARAPQKVNASFYDMLGQKWTNPGELTGMGQRMHYLLGLRNRIKYIKERKFLNETYDPHEILIYSSDYNRTIISAASQLQGMYPIKDEVGLAITEEQEKLSVPQVNIDYEEIKKERENLGLNALPQLMTLIPIKLINNNERKIKVYDYPDCLDEKNKIKEENYKNVPELKQFVEDFNNKYGERINNYFGTKSEKYDITFIYNLCDCYLSDYADKRNLSDFQSKNINLDEFNDYCLEYIKRNFLYHYFGDEEKILARVGSSKLMEESIIYMKNRVDADIKGEDIDSKYTDYSRPKMVMISAHDSTSSSDEYFMYYALGYNVTEKYKFPKFANQIALEVCRKKNAKEKRTYADYFVKGYFNDDLMFNETLDTFIEKISAQVWTDDKISDYCGFEDKIIIINNNTNHTKTKKDNAKTAYKVLMSVFIVTTAILLATTIFLAYKISQLKRIDNSSVNSINTTTGNIK